MSGDRHVDAVRRFNRFYTKQIGVLNEGLLRSPFSLSEVRVLYEIAHRQHPTAAELAADLKLDPGYLSRILHRFKREGLVTRKTSEADARQSLLSLSEKGRQTFSKLDARSHQEMAELLTHLSSGERRRLVDSMQTIERILGAPSEPRSPYLIRPPHPGDFGWVVHRHGALYAQEYGYGAEFEALVATIVGEFLAEHDPARERCWIAEKDSEIAGSIFLVQKSATIAKLRLLYVEPQARGLGIGERLIAECIRFAREARYRKITLWTQSELHAARHLYKKAGFKLAGRKAHKSFGRSDLVSETWQLSL